MNEGDERLARPGPRGPQGNQGNRGLRGAPGLSAAVRHALIFLFALAVLLAAANLFWTAHEVHASRAAIQAAQVREQAMQQQQRQVILLALCTTFGKLAALKPPAGNPAANPSRAFEQALHARLDELGTDLGCR